MRELQVPAGVGVILFNDAGQVLLGRRRSQGSVGEYGGVGGGIHPGESFDEALRRELAEECGPDLEIADLKWVCVLNYHAQSEQWVGLGATAKLVAGTPRNMEPEKMEEWGWYDLDKLPQPLYLPTVWTLEAHQTGRTWFDAVAA